MRALTYGVLLALHRDDFSKLLALLPGLQHLKPCHGTMQEARAASVRALTDGVLLALHRDDFNKLLGSLSHIRHMWRFEALRKARLILPAFGAGCIDLVH